jgi:hypothetical protein
MNIEISNLKHCFNIQYLNFEIVWDLGFHYWDFAEYRCK